jgi:hypothetical protein
MKRAGKILLITLAAICLLLAAAISFTIGWRRTGYVKARKLSSIMPFGEFTNLTDDDLKAIFAYLRTLPPVKHRVDNSLPLTYCKLCRKKHGAGDQN